MTTLDTERTRLVAAHEDAAEFYRRTLLGPEGDGPRQYLTDRGFGALLDDTAWTVGYAPADWTRLRDHLTHLGYRDETLEAAGLTQLSRRGQPIDCFRDRITFGIRNADCQLVGFTARSSPAARPHMPKYLNTGTTAIYDKSRLLFGLGESRGGGHRPVVITEGPLDAIAVDLSTNLGSTQLHPLALCGTAINNNHRAVVSALEPEKLILAFDNDDAGATAQENAYRQLHRIAHIYAIHSLSGEDPAELLRREGPRSVNAILGSPRPAIDAIIDTRLNSWPSRRENAEAAIACLRSLAKVLSDLKPEDMARQATRLQNSTNLPTHVITQELTAAFTRP